MLLVLKGERATLHTPLYGTYAIYGTYAFSVVRVEWRKSKAPHSFIWDTYHTIYGNMHTGLFVSNGERATLHTPTCQRKMRMPPLFSHPKCANGVSWVFLECLLYAYIQAYQCLRAILARVLDPS
jgi:hypothetical protein